MDRHAGVVRQGDQQGLLPLLEHLLLEAVVDIENPHHLASYVDRDAQHGAQAQIGNRTKVPKAIVLLGIGGELGYAGIAHPCGDGAADLVLGRQDLLPGEVPGHLHGGLLPLAQDQEPAFGSGELDGGVDDVGQEPGEILLLVQGAGHFQKGAKVLRAARTIARAGLLQRVHLTGGLGQPDLEAADGERVSQRDFRALHRDPFHLDRVLGPGIQEREDSILALEAAVVPGDQAVAQLEIALWRTPDRDHVLLKRVGLGVIAAGDDEMERICSHVRTSRPATSGSRDAKAGQAHPFGRPL